MKQTTLRFILVVAMLAVIIALVSCKKKEITPTSELEPCKTGVVNYVGKYKSYAKDSITIEFVSNRCPEENANDYKSEDLYKLFQKYSVQNYTFTPKTYTFSTNNKTETTFGTSIQNFYFSIVRSTDKAIVINSPNIIQSITLFKH
jgi:hypothetical protein